MTSAQAVPCALCDKPLDAAYPVPDRDMASYECVRCGEYRITPTARAMLASVAELSEKRWVLSGLTRRASDNESRLDLVSSRLGELIESAPIPRTPFDAMDRLIRLIAGRTSSLTGYVRLAPAVDYPLIFATGRDEVTDLMELLRGRSLVVWNPGGIGDLTRLTLKGWEEAERLQKSAPDSDQAFVAMAFAEELKPIFTGGIAPALRAVGYAPFRVDQRPHNDKIDDRIVAEIRQSGLLVADFTTQRGGVYWEAGFAQGLGIPVIRTCRKDELDNLHFDTRQYLHIEWTTEAELSEKLELHIRATLPGRATAKERGRE